MAISLTKEIML